MRLPKPTHEQRLPLVLLAIILVCTVFASVILPSFSASAQQTYNIEQKAKAYQAGMALGNCADHASDMTNIRTSEQKYVIGDIKLDVLKNFQLKFSSHTTHPGNMMENDDGKVGCDNVKELQALWSAIGVTDLTNFLTTSQNGNAALYSWPSDSDGTWVRPTKDAEASKALLKKIIRDHTQNTYGLSDWGEMSNSNPEQAAIKYATAYMNFDSKCVNWNDNGTNTAKVYDSSSRQMIDKKFFYKSDMENKGVTIGYGMGGRNNQMLNCGEILGILNNSTINGHFASENNRLQDAGVNISSSSSSATEDDSCESTSGPLGWIMCPVAGLLDSATDFLDGQIQSKLILQDDYFRGDSGENLQKSWTRIRNLAYIILIPIMLVMVIGTALNMEIFSAYTVKKALPRMIIAIIFIALSWHVCLLLVNVTNSVGTGIKGIVVSPFRESDTDDTGGTNCPTRGIKSALCLAEITSNKTGNQSLDTMESFSSGIGLGLLASGGLFAGFAAGGLSVGILFSTLGTAVLILGGVFLLLVLRQVVLIGLFLVAPLAILSWIFPGNDKMWKLWWGSFSKLLLMFPLIMLISGVGQIFANIIGLTASGSDTNQLVNVIIIIGAYVMPYLFIPFAFKWAGGVFGNIAGMVNDRERGVLDRLKKGRGSMRAKHIQNAKNFGRFKGNNKLTKGLNDAGGMLTNAPSGYMGARGLDRQKLAGLRSGGQTAKAEEDLKNDRVFQDNKNNEKFLLALGDRQSAEEMMATTEEGSTERAMWQQALTNASIVKSRDHEGTKLAALNAHGATGYNFASGQRGYNQLARSTARALGIQESDLRHDDQGNVIGVESGHAREADFATAMNNTQFALKGAGRFDLAGINNGTGYSYTKGVDKSSGYTAGNAKVNTFVAGAENIGIDISGDTTGSAVEMADQLDSLYGSGITDEQLTALSDHQTKLIEARNSGGTGGNAKEVDKQLEAIQRFKTRLYERHTDPSSTAPVPDSVHKLVQTIETNEAKGRSRQAIDPNLLDT